MQDGSLEISESSLILFKGIFFFLMWTYHFSTKAHNFWFGKADAPEKEILSIKSWIETACAVHLYLFYLLWMLHVNWKENKNSNQV